MRDGHRLIGVVLGGVSGGARDREMAALLDQGFEALGVPGSIMTARRQAPAPLPSMTPPAQRALVAANEQPAPPPRAKPGLLGRTATRLAANLSPVGKAEAATLPHPAPAPTVDRWGIQLGAFHAPAAAAKAARAAESLPIAKGKPVQIVEPGKATKTRLYRARLLNFSPREAQSACALLHKKNLACTVVSPTILKVADR